MEDEIVIKDIVSVFDADFLPFYVCHNKKDEPEKSLEDCLRLTDNFISNINKVTKAKTYVGFITKGKCFRYRINSTYKSNRKYDSLPKYLTEVKDYMTSKHNFLWDEEYEADDLVISFKKANPQYNCIIVSPDKDILNLAGMNFNPKKMEFVYTLPEEEIEYFWKSMVKGDSVDGIKGIPGQGEAAFEKLRQGFFWKITSDSYYRREIFSEYVRHFGEYEGIKEFTKNYLSLKIVDNVIMKDVKLNNIISE